jgi:hypothetical protein
MEPVSLLPYHGITPTLRYNEQTQAWRITFQGKRTGAAGSWLESYIFQASSEELVQQAWTEFIRRDTAAAALPGLVEKLIQAGNWLLSELQQIMADVPMENQVFSSAEKAVDQWDEMHAKAIHATSEFPEENSQIQP